MKNLISVFDFDGAELQAIFSLAQRVKANPSAYRDLFIGKVMGLIFEKPSTRTWVSFDAGFATMGGHSIYLGPNDIELGVREEVRDVARTLERYMDVVVMRTYSHEMIREFANHFKKPVINGLSNLEHPAQALTDFFTMREKLGELKEKKIAFVGDGNNVLNSLLIVAARLGLHFAFATPKQCAPKKTVLTRVRNEAKKNKARLIWTAKPAEAVSGADIVYTDVWVSMGEEAEEGKKKYFTGFQVNRALMAKAKKGAYFMHCLPAHRGEEVTNEILEGKRSVVFDQAENRLHVQKAILIYLLGTGRVGNG